MTIGTSIALAGSYFEAKNKSVDDTNPTVTATRVSGKRRDYEWQIVWRNVLAFVYLHAGFIYGFYLIFTGRVKLWTPIFGIVFSILSAMGVTAGAHRLWAHRAYKARWPMRVLLALLQTMAFQNHIYEWVRDHRVHHKYTETDADPHNAKRGFFFSHIGWLMVRKHKEVFEKGAAIDMSDLEKDPVVMFQKRRRSFSWYRVGRQLASKRRSNGHMLAWLVHLFYRTYLVVMPVLCFLLPSWVPVYFWGEDPWTSWYVASIWRYTLSLNFTWLVNSAAHIWGNKPFDKNMGATDNVVVAICAFGEGWHNYHHVFPWDYKAAELGNYGTNMSTALIDLAAKYGWAYDLKTVSAQMIKNRVARTGDGSHRSASEPAKEVSDDHDHDHDHPENPVWGWDDQDMPEEDRMMVEISHQKSD